MSVRVRPSANFLNTIINPNYRSPHGVLVQVPGMADDTRLVALLVRRSLVLSLYCFFHFLLAVLRLAARDLHRFSSFILADNHDWPPFWIGLDFAQNLSGHGRCFTFAKENIFEYIAQRVTLRPAKIGMRDALCRIANMQ